MKENQINDFILIVKETQKDYDINGFIAEWIKTEDLTDIESLDDLKDYLISLNDDGDLTNEEIIYYSNAIKYLSENDPSLQESLEIASEYGYTIDKLSSEVLASLLKSKNNEEDFYKLIDEIIEKSNLIFGSD